MFTRQEALEKYGSDYMIKKHVENGDLYQLDKAVYSEKKHVPELAVISFKYPNAIITMNSAFYYHGLTDVVPDVCDIATGRNASKISDRRIRQHFVPEDFLLVGFEETSIEGYPVRVYSVERMLVELLRFQSKMPLDYYKEILLNYRKRLPSMNVQKIQDYALLSPNSSKVCERLQMEVF